MQSYPQFFWTWPFRSQLFLFILALQMLQQTARADEGALTGVAGILHKFCSGCHNESQSEANFSVGSYQDVIDFRSESGPLIVKGDPDRSRLYQLMTSAAAPAMPPAEEPQPSPTDIAMIRRWIQEGSQQTGNQSIGWAVDADGDAEPVVRAFHVSPAPPEYQIVSAAVSIGDELLALGKHSRLDFFDTLSGNTTNSLALPTGRVSALRVSPSGKLLIVGAGKAGVSGQIILVDARTSSIEHTFQGHSDAVYSVSMSPDEKYLASGSYDRTIILWDLKEQTERLKLNGHNGAVTDLDFHPSGELLASTSTDGTVKLWHVPSGNRLDTLGQPEGEMRSVRFSLDGKFLLATGADRQIRCWSVASTNSVAINPMLESRYAHEKEILRLAVLDSETLISCSADGKAKAWTIPMLVPLGTLFEGTELPIGICHHGNSDLHIVDLKGGTHNISRDSLYELRAARERASHVTLRNENSQSDSLATPNKIEQSSQTTVSSANATAEKLSESEPNNSLEEAEHIQLPAQIKGVIGALALSTHNSDADYFQFQAKEGESWIFEVVAARNKSPMDSFLDILDHTGQPVLQTQLQALRESYFTFRGKDSSTSDDFRLHKWEDMELDEYLYANSEVTRLWLYPRGPDSGFKVYPGGGARHTFFGTTPVAHALGDPAFVVRPLQFDEIPLPNGLPIFSIYYENDDDPTREHGSDSVINFRAPADGNYFVRVRDARNFAGDDFIYELIARRPSPNFQLSVSPTQLSIPRGSGREWSVSVKRVDGMNEAIEITLDGLPPGAVATNPVIIEAGQLTARGTIYLTKDTELTAEPMAIGLTARVPEWSAPKEKASQADVGQTEVSQAFVGSNSGLEVRKPLAESIQLSVVELTEPTLYLTSSDGGGQEMTEIDIRPGQTISAQLTVERHGLEGHISCGRDDAGRNLPHGAFVDNVGLNGLLITDGNSSREIFITAAPKVKPGRYQFHFRTETEGNPTSRPIWLNVTP